MMPDRPLRSLSASSTAISVEGFIEHLDVWPSLDRGSCRLTRILTVVVR